MTVPIKSVNILFASLSAIKNVQHIIHKSESSASSNIGGGDSSVAAFILSSHFFALKGTSNRPLQRILIH